MVCFNILRFIKEENVFFIFCIKEFFLIIDLLCKKDYIEIYIIYFIVNIYIYNVLFNYNSELDWMCF